MDHLTKKDWKDIFTECGIHQGSRVLLQIDFSKLPPAAGGSLTVLEALTEIITESGLLIIPAFTVTALDPGCRYQGPCPWETMTEYRRSLHGYDPDISEADLFPLILLKMEGSCRSDHPHYSFAVWGTVDPELLKQKLDFPVSFNGVLSIFTDTTAVNLLAGVPWEDSLLVLAMAHLIGKDVVSLEKAWLHRPRRNLGKTYLVSAICQDAVASAKELLQTETRETLAGPVSLLSLYSPPDKTLEIWNRSRQFEEEQGVEE